MRKIAENYRLPYYTLSPTYSVCRDHGYLPGEQSVCPVCGERTEIYSRITGYYRPVQNWNDGKAQEFRDRRTYDVGASRLTHVGPLSLSEDEPEAAGSGSGELLLFATKTCPNCRQAEKLLTEAGIAFRKVLAEEEPQLAARYGVRQAPTLIADGETPERFVGLGAVRTFLVQNKAAR